MKLIWWLACLAAVELRADLENPHLIPFGEREVLIGNAGIAGGKSAGSAYFNPAGLSLIQETRLSVSGSSYLIHSIKATPYLRIDGTDLDYNASGFETIPSSLNSAYRLGDWTLAFSVLVPEVLSYNNRLPYTTPNTSTAINQIASVDELWLGLSLAHTWGDWSFGMSLFGIRHTQMMSVSVTSRNPATPTLATVSLTNVKASVNSLSAIVGARWQAADFLVVGLRAQSPWVRLSGSGDGYNYTQTSNGTTQTITEKDDRDIQANMAIPWDFGLGTAWTIATSFRIMADVNFQTGTLFDQYPNSRFSNSRESEARFRFNSGIELDLSDSFTLGAGFMFNPSTVPSSKNGEGDIRQDYFGVTTGVGWQASRVRTGLGVYYLWSRGRFVPLNNPSGSGEFNQQGMGASLVFSYSLGELPTEISR